MSTGAAPLDTKDAPQEEKQGKGHITLNVKCRDVELKVSCGQGSQTFKWLGLITANRYANKHPQFNGLQFIPIHVHDKNHATLFPADQIGVRCNNNDTVTVELLGPRLGPNDPNYTREKTLWELYAFSAPQDYVSVTFLFDASELGPLETPPGIYGNFNGWGEVIPMKLWKNDIWKYDCEFPALSEIVFKFVVEGNSMLSPDYNVVTDNMGNRMNYFQVTRRDENYEELKTKVPPPQIFTVREPLPVQKVSHRVTGGFVEVRQLTEAQVRKMFENDWRKIMLHDLIRQRAKRDLVKEVLWRHNEALRLIFRYYSSQGGRDIAYMNLIGWLGFCKVCHMQDKVLTIARLDGVFRRVNIEEEYDDDAVEANPTHYRNAMVIKADPFNPDNQFIRGEFYEALARAAIIKYSRFGLESHMALERLINEHVLLYALEPSNDDIRQRLLEDQVQRVYALYSPRCYALFSRYAKMDHTDLKVNARKVINVTEYEQLLRDFELVDSKMSVRSAMSVFALSQEEEMGADQSSLYEMVYAEFLEALGRLADHKYAGVPTKIGDGTQEMELHEKLQELMMSIFPSAERLRQQELRAQYAGQQLALAAAAAAAAAPKQEKKKRKRKKKKPQTPA